MIFKAPRAEGLGGGLRGFGRGLEIWDLGFTVEGSRFRIWDLILGFWI